jgi:hypothetical protein
MEKNEEEKIMPTHQVIFSIILIILKTSNSEKKNASKTTD